MTNDARESLGIEGERKSGQGEKVEGTLKKQLQGSIRIKPEKKTSENKKESNKVS